MLDENALFSRLIELVSNIVEWEDGFSNIDLPKGLSPLKFKILKILYAHESCSLSELSHCAHVNLPNCSREIKSLRAHGWVERSVSREDRRISSLRLSRDGQRLLEDRLLQVRPDFEAEFSILGRDQQLQLMDSIQVLNTLFLRINSST